MGHIIYAEHLCWFLHFRRCQKSFSLPMFKKDKCYLNVYIFKEKWLIRKKNLISYPLSFPSFKQNERTDFYNLKKIKFISYIIHCKDECLTDFQKMK